jgi:hypothetical protein
MLLDMYLSFMLALRVLLQRDIGMNLGGVVAL